MNDYQAFLEEYGFTESQVRAISETDNVIHLDGFSCYTDTSKIEGLGLFSGSGYKAGQFIMPARIGWEERTIAGRYANHSPDPNCIFVDIGNGGLSLLAVKEICIGDELTVNYRQTLGIATDIKPCFNFPALTKKYGVDISLYTLVEKIQIIEWIIINKLGNKIDDIITTHIVHGGIYARQMDCPAGYIVTGKTHLKDHICSLVKGEMTVMSEDGLMKLTAPYTFKSKAGVKRIGYAHTPCSWIAYHATGKTDIEEIEQEIFLKDELKNIDWVGGIMETITWERA